ncbi:conjugal transfer protein [Klebsiella quasipneumoniae]|nr:conjugal transfer protein [Klebsiella quasipneumoniae]
MVPVLAQAAGLSAGTSALSTFETWMYTILGTGALCYLIYRVIQAMLDHIGWMRVIISLGEVALAGAIVVVGEYMWSIWGS